MKKKYCVIFASLVLLFSAAVLCNYLLQRSGRFSVDTAATQVSSEESTSNRIEKHFAYEQETDVSRLISDLNQEITSVLTEQGFTHSDRKEDLTEENENTTEKEYSSIPQKTQAEDTLATQTEASVTETTSAKTTVQATTSTTKATTHRRTDEEEIQEVLRIINGYRSNALRVKLTLDADLCDAAEERAKEMAKTGTFSHTRPDGRACKTVITDRGISYEMFGENIAYGQSSAEQVCKEWKKSPTHYKVLTKREFRKTGIGMARNEEGVIYWCQLFSD